MLWTAWGSQNWEKQPPVAMRLEEAIATEATEETTTEKAVRTLKQYPDKFSKSLNQSILIHSVVLKEKLFMARKAWQ